MMAAGGSPPHPRSKQEEETVAETLALHTAVCLHSSKWVEPPTSIFLITCTTAAAATTLIQTEVKQDHLTAAAHLAIVMSSKV